MLYQATGKPDDASRMLEDLLRITPTPEGYALAARLHAMFGNRKQADAVKAEARRVFANIPRAPVARALR
jgi:predicted Zn-dependent protease